MMTLIIADDEPMIVKGIQKLIDWSNMGFEVIGTYGDGTAALKALITLRPDVAILDISMPGKTGIDIIKEIHGLGLETQIIFVSGFQEFNYVKEAISYGAVEYLLKPIKKDDLIRAINKGLATKNVFDKKTPPMVKESTASLPAEVMDHLIVEGDAVYRTVLLELSLSGSQGEKRLKRFSITAFLENIVNDLPGVILFPKEQYLVVVIVNRSLSDIKGMVVQMTDSIKEQMDTTVGVVIGYEVQAMSEIPDTFEWCKSQVGYLFFKDMMARPIVTYDESAFMQRYSKEDLETYKQRTIDALFLPDASLCQDAFLQYAKIVGIMAKGQKDHAWFYMNALIRDVERHFSDMKLDNKRFGVGSVLEEGKKSVDYSAMKACYSSYLKELQSLVRENVVTSEYKDIAMVKDYIKKHYEENITLELLAGMVHMNTYYFSSYFKKHTGENFKDFLNSVRMEAAMKLIITSGKKSYEIAEQVGYKDHKYFSKLFERFYGMTPSQYRKKMNR